MDPLSQGVVGAVVPQAIIKNTLYQRVGIVFAFLGGMAADLDVLIRSSTDTLLFLEYHRQFTHSLIFIPLGGLICSIVFYFLAKKKIPFKNIYIYTTLGYATHALLDACTTYGTQLFWPFSNVRVAWNNVSIIDPLFTLPLLVLLIFSYLKQRKVYAKIALIYGLCYLGFGVLQRDRAVSVGKELAESRGHQYINIEAKPSFGNLLLWKVIYSTEEKYYVDAVSVGLTSKVFEGDSIEKLDLKKDLPWLRSNTQMAKDIERFRWFSNGYIALDPHRKDFLIDIRYSIVPNEIKGLWGIELFREEQDRHAIFQSKRELDSSIRKKFFKMLVD